MKGVVVMNYILTALLLSIGWHIGKLVYIMVIDIIHNRLYETKWYSANVLGIKDDSKKQSSKKLPIGFSYGDIKS